MKKKIIYISHSRNFDYKNELYAPIRSSRIDDMHILLPHESSEDAFDARSLFEKERDDILVVAELSYPSTGQGMELGMAHMLNIPILGFCRSDAAASNSARSLCKKFFEYSDTEELISKITDAVKD